MSRTDSLGPRTPRTRETTRESSLEWVEWERPGGRTGRAARAGTAAAAVLLLVVAGLPAAGATQAADGPRALRPWADLSASAGPRTPELLGLSHAPETAGAIDTLDGGPVPAMRVDSYLDDLAPSPLVRDFGDLDGRIDRAQAAGAEPVVILSYMPTWMSRCPDQGFRDPNRCPPASLEAWHGLVEKVVSHAADRGVTAFEVWNEPDNPLFFQGSPVDYLRMYEAAARAVEDVEEQRSEDLAVGGPAAVGPDPTYIPALLETAAARDLPLDFVSWHWYANNPFIGEFDHENLPRETPEALDRESPALDPRHYPAFGEMVESWIDGAEAQGLEAGTENWVTEWNVNAGDDRRHRTHEGAAFAAASLAQMEASPVDRAFYFNTQGESWGILGPEGEPRPAYEAFRLVGDLPVDRAEAGPGTFRSHLHVQAAAGGGEAGLVLANFHGAEPRPLTFTLDVQGAPSGEPVQVREVTAPGEDASVTVLDGTGDRRSYRVSIPAQSVVSLGWGS